MQGQNMTGGYDQQPSISSGTKFKNRWDSGAPPTNTRQDWNKPSLATQRQMVRGRRDDLGRVTDTGVRLHFGDYQGNELSMPEIQGMSQDPSTRLFQQHLVLRGYEEELGRRRNRQSRNDGLLMGAVGALGSAFSGGFSGGASAGYDPTSTAQFMLGWRR